MTVLPPSSTHALVDLHIGHTVRTERDLVNLPAFLGPRPDPLPVVSGSFRVLIGSLFINKELLQTKALGDKLAAAQQTAITSPMPEAPAQTDAFVAADHDLATYLTDGKVDQSPITCLAGETSRRPTKDMWTAARG
ncbi:hypothetical protein V8F33_006549 [Rhypophila sp. PSN 637]